ncbi:MAG: iron ABC transporter substrate-binding protein [Acidimicrobiales bacterium]
MSLFRMRLVAVVAVVALVAAACGGGDGAGSDAVSDGARTITVYSGRNKALVGDLLERFTKDTGIKLAVRYADSASLAAQLLEEGGRSPADVFFSQDAGAIGALSKKGLLGPAPAAARDAVEPRYRSTDGTWVGVSGRARVIVYNSKNVPEAEVPASVFELTDPKWKGRLAVAPSNASFQSFVTAMRIQAGEARTADWLRGLKANEPKTYPSNIPVVEAVDTGQADLGLVNHYYLYERIAAVGADKVVARNAFTRNGDPGALINVAAVGILKSSRKQAGAAAFVTYLLSPAAQRFFAQRTHEYPLLAGVPLAEGLTPLADIESPDIDLSDLDTLEQTLAMIREAGLL